jgi:hypothetical protein
MFHLKSGFGAGAVAALAVVLAAGPTAASGWTVVPVPPTGGFLSAVSADSGSDAWAVGATAGSVWTIQALADHWNGTSWRQVAIPAGRRISLTAVSAASATDAWTVGYFTGYGNSQALYHWDGTAWTWIKGITHFPDAGLADLGPGNAYAVGGPLLHGDGTSWTAVAYPDPRNPGATTTSGGSLGAISAAGASDIWAVGSYDTSTTCTAPCSQTFSLHWDGTRWALVPMPPVDRSTNPRMAYQIRSVDVLSPSDVWAAGYSSAGTLTEHWNGTRWTIVPSPSPGTSAQLTGISGSSPASVWAAGSYTAPGASQPQTLTLIWNGTSWATVPSPHPGSTSQLNAVAAAPGAAATWAAGGSTNTSGATTPLALKNG